jgi:hypothetical protein
MRRKASSPRKKTALVELGQSFTAEECARLRTLRQRFSSLPVYVELALDPQRLRFARWLVEQGKLRESL